MSSRVYLIHTNKKIADTASRCPRFSQEEQSAPRDYASPSLSLMEFPSLGTHCAKQSCSRLDFLPFECDICHKIFCKDHRGYEDHECHDAYVKDVRVPVCPLCQQPVPVSRGDDPNIKVNAHIQNDCKADESKKKAYSNRCSYPGCKKKELVPVRCGSCRQNFCLRHRFDYDHNCPGHPPRLGGGRAMAGGRGRKAGGTKPQQTTMTAIGAELNEERRQRLQEKRQMATSSVPSRGTGATSSSSRGAAQTMSEDEALARAMAASLADEPPDEASSHTQTSHSPPANTSYDEDRALAEAIAASLDEEKPKRKPAQSSTQSSSSRKSQDKRDANSCNIS